MINQNNPEHNVQAWYFEPIYPDNTDNTKRNQLDWVDDPIPFKCAYGKLTKNGFNILSNYVVTSKGAEIITESTIDFDNQGKIAIGRVQPFKTDASKIVKDGITTVPTNRSRLLGTRFATNYNSKVIKFG